ncbi:MAG: AAA family ATPase [Tepidimonas ignava]|uniref:ATP-binding protein n=1 Tax=Tepidimonas ignava TaxID=114249 RepID=UPI00391BE81A
MTDRRKLPIGIQTFAKIRGEGCYYVDKTPLIARLAEQGSFYFLSRPRRFGKSLLIDTIAEAFAGQRALFEGGEAAVALGVDPAVANRPRLFLAEHWDWSQRHPVVRLSFAGGRLEQRSDLERSIRRQLRDNAHRLGVTLSDPDDVAGSFDELITRAAEAHGQQAVVLVDEYDKPILDNLEAPEVARAMREGLRNLYSVIKGRDADVRFAMLTGVSKFSKVSIFSGLNNLNDITLDDRYGTLCGYTEEDLDTVFAPEFEAAASEGQPLDRAEVRRWYNGYAWGPTAVYNPFDVLLLLDKRQYRAHWFETGTPTFLVQWLQRKGFFTPRLEQLWASEALLSAFDVDGIEPEAMLWQTGYLTIGQVLRDADYTAYELRLPNHEVRTALNSALMAAWHPEGLRAAQPALLLRRMLASADAQALRTHFERLFASIPHDWYRANPIAQYEGYFASVCYSHLASLGVEIIAEDVSNEGQCDLTVKHAGTAWVFEFKVVEGDQGTGEALRQLQAKDYAAKHRGAPGVERVIEVGVEFSRTRRQIVGWDVRQADGR